MTGNNSRYINRELSWLEFNQRVLDESRDSELPLLERGKFLAITSSNLDEFFMVRVGGLQMLVDQGVTRPDPAGMTPEQQLEAISRRTHRMVQEQYDCFLKEVEPNLLKEGIRRLKAEEYNEEQETHLDSVFNDEIFTVYTPMAVSSADDFPLLPGLTLNMCVRLAPTKAEPGVSRYALIPFGRSATRIITLRSAAGYDFTLLEEVVAASIQEFFPGEEVLESIPFRITRNADMVLQEDNAADLLLEMEEILHARKLSRTVRLEIADHASPIMLEWFKDVLEIGDSDIYLCPGPLDLGFLMQLSAIKGFDTLRNESWTPRQSPLFDPTISIFENIAQHSLLFYHPYESFEPVVRLVEEAAEDPDVLAIKQILYRTSRNSPIVKALIRAAERDKHVTALVELKARFDEARNIEWARALENAGVQVIYGVKGLKTHAKICLVVRREPHGIQRYVHFGTGNYNEATAKLYSDVSYMTSDEELAADASIFFNAVTGYSQPQTYRKIQSAPIGLREKLLELIESETDRVKQGQKAGITAKMNSLVDPTLIEALYTASEAGVPIRLNVRGICCLRPGNAPHNKNIKVISIIDRYLEHARVIHFHHGGDDLVFLSSADWMPRNLDKRVELLVPVEEPYCRDRLINILRRTFQDNVKARVLQSNGSYRRVKPTGRQKAMRSQEYFYRKACEAVQQSEQSRRTVFEPHRSPDDESA